MLATKRINASGRRALKFVGLAGCGRLFYGETLFGSNRALTKVHCGRMRNLAIWMLLSQNGGPEFHEFAQKVTLRKRLFLY